MNTESIFKIPELGIDIIGLFLVIFGWIIPYRQSIKSQKREKEYSVEFQKNVWKKELIDKQISLFYGPISSLLMEDRLRFSFILYEMGRSHVFKSEQYKLADLSEEDQKRWKHYVDTYLIPTHNKILEIIRQNKHLIYKSEIPNSLNKYIQFALGWEFLDNQFRNGVPNYYEYYFSYNLPVDFSDYINNTLELLLKNQSELTEFDKYSVVRDD